MPKGQKTRERIVAEAASLFNQRGFEGSSMSELIHPIGAVGIWFGLDPNDTPLLLRDAGTRDIYALTLDRR